MMNKIWKHILLLWGIVSFYLVVLRRLSFGVVFFDIESVSHYLNLIPFDFLIHLVRNYSMAAKDGASLPLSEIWFFLHDFVLNVILFIPVGICLTGMNVKVGKSFVITGGIVLFYETAQLAFSIFHIGTGIFDINDIIAAIMGMFLGICAFNILGIVIPKIKQYR